MYTNIYANMSKDTNIHPNIGNTFTSIQIHPNISRHRHTAEPPNPIYKYHPGPNKSFMGDRNLLHITTNHSQSKFTMKTQSSCTIMPHAPCVCTSVWFGLIPERRRPTSAPRARGAQGCPGGVSGAGLPVPAPRQGGRLI